MLVTIKLTPSQQKRAESQAALVASRTLEDGESYFGNLLGAYTPDPCMNRNQWLELAGAFVTYEGEREPFWADGAADVLKEILGHDAWASVPVVEYKSSVRHLAWWQTQGSWAVERIRSMDVADALGQAVEWLRDNARYQWAQHAAFIALERAGNRPMPGLGSAAYRRAVAEGTIESLRKQDAIRRALRDLSYGL